VSPAKPLPPAVRAVSVVALDALPQARVMAASLATHQPDWSLELVLVASSEVAARSRGGLPDGVLVTSVSDVLDVGLEETLARHDPEELRTLLIAAVLARRLQETPGALVHLPASGWVIGSLDRLIAPLDDAAVVLVPRMRDDPPDDGVEPAPETLLRLGRIAPDLIALRSSAEAEAFLGWWGASCERVYGDLRGRTLGLSPEHHRWLWRSLELALIRPAIASGDPAIGASAWNLHEHTLSADGDDLILDGSTPVALLDLPGFRPDIPWRLHPLLARTRVRRPDRL
jgi:hypothetical protein